MDLQTLYKKGEHLDKHTKETPPISRREFGVRLPLQSGI